MEIAIIALAFCCNATTLDEIWEMRSAVSDSLRKVNVVVIAVKMMLPVVIVTAFSQFNPFSFMLYYVQRVDFQVQTDTFICHKTSKLYVI